MKQQPDSFGRRAAVDILHTDGLPRRKAHHRLVVEIIGGLSVVKLAPASFFQKQSVEAEVHAMRCRLHIFVEMHYPDQRMPGLESEIAVVAVDGVCFVDFHVNACFAVAKIRIIWKLTGAATALR